MVGEIELSEIFCRSDGIYYLVMLDGIILCNALTHSYDDLNNGWCAKTPHGLYTAVRGVHKLHTGTPFETFEITGVPGHSGILFHKGNFNKDSEGCFLLGMICKNPWGVMHSADTFNEFMARLRGQNTVTVRIADD